jgi:predicted KAP-like P-loop ATPase
MSNGTPDPVGPALREVLAADRRSDDGRQDRLERLPLAAKVATLIGNYRGRESLVVGIEGPWGAGKTSFSALVVKEVEARACAVVVPFNPWNLSQQNELVAEFFASLAGALAHDDGTGAVPSEAPYRAWLRAGAKRSLAIPSLASAGLKQVLRGKRTPHEERGDIHAKLGKLEGRVLVVIDDIDRLDHEQTRLLMKLVRIASSLPNVVFLLAYDRRRVAASVEEDSRPGDDYLKTIVHIVFTLREPSRHELNSILFGQLQEALSRIYGQAQPARDDQRWRELVFARVPPLFRTTADVVAFVTSLRLSFSLIGKDAVDKFDLVGIEAIRFFAPHLYAAIGTNKTLFVGSRTRRHLSESDSAAESLSRYEDLLLLAPEELRTELDSVARHLFPNIGLGRDTANDFPEEWRREKRVCAAEHFAAYFQLGILEPTVSESEVLFLRRRLVSAEAVRDALYDYMSDGRLGALLSQLLRVATLFSESDAKALLLGLWALERELGEAHLSAADHDGVPALAVQLARSLLRCAVKEDRRAAFLDELVAETAAVLAPLALVDGLEQHAARDAETPLLSPAELASTRARLLARMPTASPDRSSASGPSMRG